MSEARASEREQCCAGSCNWSPARSTGLVTRAPDCEVQGEDGEDVAMSSAGSRVRPPCERKPDFVRVKVGKVPVQTARLLQYPG